MGSRIEKFPKLTWNKPMAPTKIKYIANRNIPQFPGIVMVISV